MSVSRRENMGFLDDMEVDDGHAESTLESPMTTREARSLRRAGRFRLIRVASRDRNLYQDAQTGDFWELKEGTVYRLVDLDDVGVVKNAVSLQEREAAGSTGYYRERLNQDTGYQPGAGEKQTDRHSSDEDNDEDSAESEDGAEDKEGLGADAADGVYYDKIHQHAPYNEDGGYTNVASLKAAVVGQSPFEQGQWVVDRTTEDEFEVVDQGTDGRVKVIDDSGREQYHPSPQNLELKEMASLSSVLDFRSWGRDVGVAAGAAAACEAQLVNGKTDETAMKRHFADWKESADEFHVVASDAEEIASVGGDAKNLMKEFTEGGYKGFKLGWKDGLV